MNYLPYLIYGLLLVIFFEDLRNRAISLWVLLLLMVGLSIDKELWQFQQQTYLDISINLFFLVIQLLLLTVYFSLKYKQLVNICSNYLGLGDIVFLIIVTLWLDPLEYIFFYIGSLLLVGLGAIIHSALANLSKNLFSKPSHTHQTSIPLAGLQAILLLIYSVFRSQLYPEWLLGHLI